MSTPSNELSLILDEIEERANKIMAGPWYRNPTSVPLLVKALRRQQRAVDYIRLQADSWTNTGDTRSLREAMKDFVQTIDACNLASILNQGRAKL